MHDIGYRVFLLKHAMNTALPGLSAYKWEEIGLMLDEEFWKRLRPTVRECKAMGWRKMACASTSKRGTRLRRQRRGWGDVRAALAALGRAEYEIIDDPCPYYAHVPELEGVCATGKT